MLYAGIALTLIAGCAIAAAVQLIIIRKLLGFVLVNLTAIRRMMETQHEAKDLEVDAREIGLETRKNIESAQAGANAFTILSWPLDAVLVIFLVWGAIWIVSDWGAAMDSLREALVAAREWLANI